MTDPLPPLTPEPRAQDPDPARGRKLITALVAMLAIVAITYALMAKQEAPHGNAVSNAAPVPASVASDNPAASSVNPPAVTERMKADILKVKPDDLIFGDANAPVTIIEYASLSCSHCARFQSDIFPKLDEKYIATGKVKLVHRFFPLNEPALRASQIVACEKEKAHAFLKVFFTTQDQWAFDPGFKESLARIAGVGGLSRERFDACIADKALEEKILASRKEGQDTLGVDSTPTFFINGEKYSGERSLEQFSAVIDPLLK